MGIVDRFYAKVKLGTANECWQWLGRRVGQGQYGQFSVTPTKAVQAHRWTYERYFGAIPKGMIVRHKCHNVLCVNPAHLRLGTHQDNMDDSVKDRRFAHGARHPRASIPDEEIPRILARLSSEGRGILTRLAEEYNVTKSCISHIRQNRSRKYVEREV